MVRFLNIDLINIKVIIKMWVDAGYKLLLEESPNSIGQDAG